MIDHCPKCGRRSFYLRIGNAIRECCAICGDWLSEKTEEVKTANDKVIIDATFRLFRLWNEENNLKASEVDQLAQKIGGELESAILGHPEFKEKIINEN